MKRGCLLAFSSRFKPSPSAAHRGRRRLSACQLLGDIGLLHRVCNVCVEAGQHRDIEVMHLMKALNLSPADKLVVARGESETLALSIASKPYVTRAARASAVMRRRAEAGASRIVGKLLL